jgi:hypothetical protein
LESFTITAKDASPNPRIRETRKGNGRETDAHPQSTTNDARASLYCYTSQLRLGDFTEIARRSDWQRRSKVCDEEDDKNRLLFDSTGENVCTIMTMPERSCTHMVPDQLNIVENENLEYVSALVLSPVSPCSLRCTALHLSASLSTIQARVLCQPRFPMRLSKRLPI